MGGFFISNFSDNQLWLCTLLISCCLSSAKIQNFKAIHNFCNVSVSNSRLFIICKDTKFQSNSQLLCFS